MKINKYTLIIALIATLIIPIFPSSANAATGYQGYTVYRDNAFGFGDLQLHAGFMHGPYSTSYYPIVQAPGFGNNVKYDQWSTFMSGENFIGIYKPKATASSYDRDLFVTTATRLAGEYIPYNAYHQVYYNTETAGTWVESSEISSMRCDGVVEYIYEWCGFRVFGTDDDWDISRNNIYALGGHSILWVSPISQKNYLTPVSYSVP